MVERLEPERNWGKENFFFFSMMMHFIFLTFYFVLVYIGLTMS